MPAESTQCCKMAAMVELRCICCSMWALQCHAHTFLIDTKRARCLTRRPMLSPSPVTGLPHASM